MRVKLKDIYLFKDIDDDTLSKIEEFTSFVKFSEQNIIFYEGDTSDHLYC